MAQPDIRYAPETCLFCEGQAADFWRDDHHHNRCPVCQGVGSLLVAQPARQCAFCRGRGINFQRGDDHYTRCPVCKGVGWAHSLPPR